MYQWCFHKNHHGIIENFRIANNCHDYSEIENIIDLKPDGMSRNKKEQRNNKIKRKAQVFRFHYKINDRIAYIVSRFSHWIIILSGDKEHLFHQNMINLKEYEEMLLSEQPQFHLHKVIDNSPMAIQELFDEIENHDIYVLEDRYQASIKSKRFTPTDFDTPHF